MMGEFIAVTLLTSILSTSAPTIDGPALILPPHPPASYGALSTGRKLATKGRAAFIGLFAGGAIGAVIGGAIDRHADCRCDGPAAPLVTIPVGALSGAVIAAIIAGR